MKYAACSFSSKPGAKTYDYIAPFTVQPGDMVKVPSARNSSGWQRVYVVEVKDASELASASIIEIIPPEEPENGEEK